VSTVRLKPIPPGTAITLDDDNARLESDPAPKHELEEQVDRFTKRIGELQHALYAERAQALLVVLQGRDTSGKDGVIRKVFDDVNPAGVAVANFKAPTPVELAHDFLWRAHQAVPPKGLIGVFNRSHYEDVLVVRVHQLVPEAVWRPRYEQINLFERILTENGVTILKFFLHISREEQRERLLARLESPDKYWKFSPGDLGERDLWDDYTRAYEDVLRLTSTTWAPWYLVPADRKPARDLLVAATVVNALERIDPQYPGPPDSLGAFRRRLAARSGRRDRRSRK
jgi:PPK2 family polyphosphate:nucleotide phosphotransferase